MADLPQRVEIAEEGPREGFQIEPGPIPTADKVALIDALADTGLRHIQICSFVNPRLVPGWADAEAVAAGFTPRPGRYSREAAQVGPDGVISLPPPPFDALPPLLLGGAVLGLLLAWSLASRPAETPGSDELD